MRRGHRRRPAQFAAGAIGVVAAGALTACSPGNHAEPQDLGRVPIPTPPAVRATPTASPGHAQLVSIGDTVRVEVGGRSVLVTASGPELRAAVPPSVSAPAAPDRRSAGTVTVTLRAASEPVTLCAAGLAARDELGHAIPLAADQPCATAAPGRAAALRLSGTFAAGHATLVWQSAGKPLVTWDFEVELD